MSRVARAAIPATALLLIGTAYAWRLWLLRVRVFDPDEFEHLHAAWSLFRGMLPYRDFFQIHPPWFYFLLAPFYALFSVDTNPDDAISFVLFARGLSWLFTGGILALTFRLGRVWGESRVAWIGTLFLSNTIIFLEKSLEIRPDVPAVLLWLACLAILLPGMQGEGTAPWRFALSGALLGGSVLFTQKLLFAFLGLGPALLWYLLDRRANGRVAARAWNLACLAAGFCVPILLTLAYFALRDGLPQFIHFNLLWVIGWKRRISRYAHLAQLARQDPFLVTFGATGVVTTAVGLFRRERFRQGDVVLVPRHWGSWWGCSSPPCHTGNTTLRFSRSSRCLRAQARSGCWTLPAVDGRVTPATGRWSGCLRL